MAILKNKRNYSQILYVCIIVLTILSQPFQCLSFAATYTVNFNT